MLEQLYVEAQTKKRTQLFVGHDAARKSFDNVTSCLFYDIYTANICINVIKYTFI